MSKKGATKTGSGSHRRARDGEAAKYLAKAPVTWRKNAQEWPYHNNKGKAARKYK